MSPGLGTEPLATFDVIVDGIFLTHHRHLAGHHCGSTCRIMEGKLNHIIIHFGALSKCYTGTCRFVLLEVEFELDSAGVLPPVENDGRIQRQPGVVRVSKHLLRGRQLLGLGIPNVEGNPDLGQTPKHPDPPEVRACNYKVFFSVFTACS